MKKKKRPSILAYYFPNWHVDPRNEKWHGTGWTEWNVTRCAVPRFDGHDQPKKPLWGYEDEADPAVMAKKTDAASAHGIDGFMFDWYFYDDGPYRNRCIEEGFFKAPNAGKMKFAVMWCNHNAIQAHPGCRAFPRPVLCGGETTCELFHKATQYCIDHYFGHPSYLKVDGKIYFSIYKIDKMVKELGGTAVTRELLDDFRARVAAAGLGELHLNAVYVGYRWANSRFDAAESAAVNTLTKELGVDSRSGHTWFWTQEGFPCIDYAGVAKENVECYTHFSKDFDLPYNPVYQVGWDSSPRAVASDVWEFGEYPFLPVFESAPASFEKYLQEAKKFCESDDFTGDFLMLHSWNEWTEGTYLEPDERYKFAYLEAIRNTFGLKEE